MASRPKKLLYIKDGNILRGDQAKDELPNVPASHEASSTGNHSPAPTLRLQLKDGNGKETERGESQPDQAREEKIPVRKPEDQVTKHEKVDEEKEEKEASSAAAKPPTGPPPKATYITRAGDVLHGEEGRAKLLKKDSKKAATPRDDTFITKDGDILRGKQATRELIRKDVEEVLENTLLDKHLKAAVPSLQLTLRESPSTSHVAGGGKEGGGEGGEGREDGAGEKETKAAEDRGGEEVTEEKERREAEEDTTQPQEAVNATDSVQNTGNQKEPRADTSEASKKATTEEKTTAEAVASGRDRGAEVTKETANGAGVATQVAAVTTNEAQNQAKEVTKPATTEGSAKRNIKVGTSATTQGTDLKTKTVETTGVKKNLRAEAIAKAQGASIKAATADITRVRASAEVETSVRAQGVDVKAATANVTGVQKQVRVQAGVKVQGAEVKAATADVTGMKSSIDAEALAKAQGADVKVVTAGITGKHTQAEVAALAIAQGADTKTSSATVTSAQTQVKAEASARAQGAQVDAGTANIAGAKTVVQANASARAYGADIKAGTADITGQKTNVKAEASVNVRGADIKAGTAEVTGAEKAVQATTGAEAVGATVSVARSQILGKKKEASAHARAEVQGAKIQAGTAHIKGSDLTATAEAKASAAAFEANAGNFRYSGGAQAGVHATAEAKPGIDAGNVQIGASSGGVSTSTKLSVGNIGLTWGMPGLNISPSLNLGIGGGGGGGGARSKGGTPSRGSDQSKESKHGKTTGREEAYVGNFQCEEAGQAGVHALAGLGPGSAGGKTQAASSSKEKEANTKLHAGNVSITLPFGPSLHQGCGDTGSGLSPGSGRPGSGTHTGSNGHIGSSGHTGGNEGSGQVGNGGQSANSEHTAENSGHSGGDEQCGSTGVTGSSGLTGNSGLVGNSGVSGLTGSNDPNSGSGDTGPTTTNTIPPLPLDLHMMLHTLIQRKGTTASGFGAGCDGESSGLSQISMEDIHMLLHMNSSGGNTVADTANALTTGSGSPTHTTGGGEIIGSGESAGDGEPGTCTAGKSNTDSTSGSGSLRKRARSGEGTPSPDTGADTCTGMKDTVKVSGTSDRDNPEATGRTDTNAITTEREGHTEPETKAGTEAVDQKTKGSGDQKPLETSRGTTIDTGADTDTTQTKESTGGDTMHSQLQDVCEGKTDTLEISGRTDEDSSTESNVRRNTRHSGGGVHVQSEFGLFVHVPQDEAPKDPVTPTGTAIRIGWSSTPSGGSQKQHNHKSRPEITRHNREDSTYGKQLASELERKLANVRHNSESAHSSEPSKIPADRDEVKRWLTERLRPLGEKLTKSSTPGQSQSGCRGEDGGSHGELDTQDHQPSSSSSDCVCERNQKPFGDQKNIHTLDTIRTESPRQLKPIGKGGKIMGFDN